MQNPIKIKKGYNIASAKFSKFSFISFIFLQCSD